MISETKAMCAIKDKEQFKSPHTGIELFSDRQSAFDSPLYCDCAVVVPVLVTIQEVGGGPIVQKDEEISDTENP